MMGGSKGSFSTESSSRVLEIPLRSKHSSSCDGQAASNGGSWLSLVVVGGEGGGSRVWVRVLERERMKNMFFLTAGHICNVQDLLG